MMDRRFISNRVTASRWRVQLAVIGLALLCLAAGGGGADSESSLPSGYGSAHWGMTVEELRRLVPVEKVDLTDPFSYAEHLEQEPEVYSATTTEGKRVEYYFYHGLLYKIFIIHARNQPDRALYRQLTQQLIATYGPPTRAYDEMVFGLTISHTTWEGPKTVLDLRYGGGFVFQVLTDRIQEDMKERALQHKKFI